MTAETRSGRSALKNAKTRPKPTPGPGEVIAPPPRLRRRRLLVAGSVAAICLGALLAMWGYTATSTAHEVVGVRSAVQRGQVIERDDLLAVRVGVDPALRPVPVAELDALVGQRAAVDLPAGGLVTRDAVTAGVVPGRGMSVVGVALPVSLMPGEPLQVGDR
ncbi:MAG TPA: SAF domain-containing protein, partial [Propionibacteriaceae bacterium]